MIFLKQNRFLIGTFLLIVTILSHKLTFSPIWFDEAVEYWYSKILIGSAVGVGFDFISETHNMYDRIILTFQPPLYNFIVHFWLNFFDTEYGFRFFGVLVTSIGAIGFFLSCRKIFHNEIFSSVATLIFATLHPVAYYAQECGEYFLLICLLTWELYFFICILEKPSKNFLFGFFATSILAIYSQYGCGFVVLILSILILKNLAFDFREEETLRFALKLFGAGVVSILLLIKFFLLKQIAAMEFYSGIKDHSPEFFMNPVVDFFKSLGESLRFLYFQNLPMEFLPAIGMLFFTLFAILFFKTRNEIFKSLILSCLGIWLIYFLSVKFKFYAYQNYEHGFGLRWDLILIPIFSLTLVSFIFEFFRFKKILAVISTLCIGLNLYSLDQNWIKDNSREIFRTWTTRENLQIPTIVHPWTSSVFQFYLHHDSNYEPSFQKNILNFDVVGREVLQSMTGDFDFEKVFGWIFERYDFPAEFYYIGTKNDLWTNCMLQFLGSKNYRGEVVQDGITTLIHFKLNQ